MMRLFIAINCEGELRRALLGLQDELRRRGVRGNYSRPENLHLTLAFIGEYGDPDRVLEALEPLRFTPLTLRLHGVGAFGETWWAGLEKCPELDLLARRLRHLLAEGEIPFDRKRFSPHITILREPRFQKDPRRDELQLPAAVQRVDRITLLCSTRGKNGMIYTPMGTIHASSE